MCGRYPFYLFANAALLTRPMLFQTAQCKLRISNLPNFLWQRQMDGKGGVEEDTLNLTMEQLSMEERNMILQYRSKTTTSSKMLSGEQMLSYLINDLTLNGYISPISEWRQPDLTASSHILGLQWTPQLVGRSEDMQLARSHVTFEEFNRKPIIFFEGIPGTGKTRLLQEAASVLFTTDMAVFSVTFNHQQNALLNNEIERQLVTMDIALPVALRLMHSYMGSNKSWGSFAAAALTSIQSVARSRPITIDIILSYLADHFSKQRVLLLVDETLRWLDINIERKQVQDMVSITCQACDRENRAVLFTAMSSIIFLSEEETETSRQIVPITLCLLKDDESLELTSIAIGYKAVATIHQLTGLARNSIISTLNALAVGGLPRAAETLAAECKSVGNWQQTPVTISSLAARVYSSLSRKYSFPLQITRLAVLGTATMSRSEVIPGRSDTLEDAVLRGWLPKPSRINGRVNMEMPPVLMLCSLLNAEGKLSNDLRAAAYYFSSLVELSHRNLWEEFVLRTLILRSHMLPDNAVSQTNKTASLYFSEVSEAEESTDNSADDELCSPSSPFSQPLSMASSPPSLDLKKMSAFCEKSKIFALFPGVRKHKSAPTFSVQRFRTLSNMILEYPHRRPPTPSELINKPELMQHLFVSESSAEPGIDGLKFEWKDLKVVTAEELMAVGLQCKWSDLDASTVLSKSQIIDAYNLFVRTMTALGWKEDQCVLVFLVHHSVTQNVFDGDDIVSSLPSNIAVASLNNGLEKWLGPTLTQWARCLHAVRISHGPYGKFIPTKNL